MNDQDLNLIEQVEAYWLRLCDSAIPADLAGKMTLAYHAQLLGLSLGLGLGRGSGSVEPEPEVATPAAPTIVATPPGSALYEWERRFRRDLDAWYASLPAKIKKLPYITRLVRGIAGQCRARNVRWNRESGEYESCSPFVGDIFLDRETSIPLTFQGWRARAIAQPDEYFFPIGGLGKGMLKLLGSEPETPSS